MVEPGGGRRGFRLIDGVNQMRLSDAACRASTSLNIMPAFSSLLFFSPKMWTINYIEGACDLKLVVV